MTFPTKTGPASLAPDALLDHWHTGLPQPWAHIQQHLNGGDIHTRTRGHRHIAAAYQNTETPYSPPTKPLPTPTEPHPPHPYAPDQASASEPTGSRTRRAVAKDQRSANVHPSPQTSTSGRVLREWLRPTVSYHVRFRLPLADPLLPTHFR